jgi:hypothetical protein
MTGNAYLTDKKSLQLVAHLADYPFYGLGALDLDDNARMRLEYSSELRVRCFFLLIL